MTTGSARRMASERKRRAPHLAGVGRHGRAPSYGRALEELGWYVLRVAEQHVIADLDAVVERVSQTALRIAAR